MRVNKYLMDYNRARLRIARCSHENYKARADERGIFVVYDCKDCGLSGMMCRPNYLSVTERIRRKGLKFSDIKEQRII